MKVLYKPVGKPFELREIPNSLEACQELVGGYIETVTLAENLILVCNEEGLIHDLPSNSWLGYDFRGDFFLVGRDEDVFTDVPEAMRCLAMREEDPA